MSTKGGKATYTVWVGNLKETVKEKDLRRVFSKCTHENGIASCKVMRDDDGQSKKFGFVNFYSEDDAERAARTMAGFKIESVPIKTKGPKKEGHPVRSVDYRNITDCSFYMETGNCKKGEQCPYRHSEHARASTEVCPQWTEKKCSNSSCPYRHPGGMSTSKGGVLPMTDGLHSCDGRCGDPICEALFRTEDALRQHIGQLHVVQPDALTSDDQNDYESVRTESPDNLSTSAPDVEIIMDSEPEGDIKAPWPLVTPPSGDVVGGVTAEGVEGRGSISPDSNTEDSVGDGRGYGDSSNGVDEISGNGDVDDDDNDDDDDDDDDDSGEDDEEDEEREEEEREEKGMVEQSDDKDHFEYSRLESLTEDEPSFSDRSLEQEPTMSGDAHGKSFPPLVHPPHSPRHTGHHSEPVGVFWDIENCPVPLNKSAFVLANKMRKKFFEGKREAEFVCVCDINKERKEVMDDLNKAQVTVVHVSAVAKNAADDKLRQSLRRFANTYHPPCTVVLISGDVNFAPELKDLRYTHNITVTLVHNKQASEALKGFANNLVLFDDLLQDVEPASVRPAPPSSCKVTVSGLPAVNVGPKRPAELKRIETRLRLLCDNCGGKVVKVNPNTRTAIILFRSIEAATKAQKRMTGEDVFGSKIKVKVQRNAQGDQKKHPPPSRPHPSSVAPSGHPAAPRGAQGSPVPRRTRSGSLPHGGPGGQVPYGGPGGQVPYGGPGGQPPYGGPGGQVPYGGPGGQVPYGGRGGQVPYGGLGGQVPYGGPGGQVPYGGPRGQVPYGGPGGQIPYGGRGGQVPYGGPGGPASFQYGCVPAPPMGWVPQPSHKHRPPHVDVYDGPPPLAPPSSMPVRSNTVPQPMPSAAPPLPFVKLLIKVQADPDVRRDPNILHLSLNNVFTKARVQARHLAFLWYSYSQLDVLLQLEILPSATWQNDSVAVLCSKGSLTAEVAKNFGDVCCKEVEKVCQQEEKPWQAELCNWADDKESERHTRSHVIELLVKQPDGYMKWTKFKKKFFSLYNCPISELTIQTTCKDAIQLLGNTSPTNQPVDQVIMPSELSPLIRVCADAKTMQCVRGNMVGVLIAEPEKQIKLLKIVSAYERKYGPLPIAKKDGMPLLNIIEKSFTINGKTPSSFTVVLKNSIGSQEHLPLKQAGSSSNLKPRTIEELNADFQTLVKEVGSGGAIPYQGFQQAYQTHFHRSFRVSDFISHPDAAMPDLIKLCKGVQVQGDYIVLVAAPSEVRLDESASDLSPSNIERFRSDCASVFRSSTLPGMSLVQFKEEYEKHLGRQLKLAEYGAKKLVQLLEAISDTVKITGEKDSKYLQLLDSKHICERNVEQLLYDNPSHKITLDVFVSEYTKKFGPLEKTYYGYNKLLSLLESMPTTVKLGKEDGKWCACLSPVRLFACEIKELLRDHPSGMGISAVNPNYKIKFQRDFSPNNYGFSKLIAALEAIQDVIDIEGVGPSRIIKLKAVQLKTQMELPSQTLPSVQPAIGGTGPTELSTPQVLEPEIVSQHLEPRFSEAERHRVCSESKSALRNHPKHSMTLKELWDSFETEYDPASPSIDDLDKCLKEENAKKHTFEITVNPGSLSSNVISLTMKLRHDKLQQDLLHVFVCCPTQDFSLSLINILKTYNSCFGHMLNLGVYGASELSQLMGIPCVAEVIKLNEANKTCYLTEAGIRIVLTRLLSGLLFTEGSALKVPDLLRLYQARYGVGLSWATAAEVLRNSSSFQILNKETIDLAPNARFVEQVRHLLTKNSGRVLYSDVTELFSKEFGQAPSKVFPVCSDVARLTRRKWLVWKSSSCAYPHRNGASIAAGAISAAKRTAPVAASSHLGAIVKETSAEAVKKAVEPCANGAVSDAKERVAEPLGRESAATIDRVGKGVVRSTPEPRETPKSKAIVEDVDGGSSDGPRVDINAPTRDALLPDKLPDGEGNATSVAGMAEAKTTASCDVNAVTSANVQGLDFGPATKEQGELSGREPERVMSSVEKPVTRSAPRRKPNIAVRFPGMAPAAVHETVGLGGEEQKQPSSVISKAAGNPEIGGGAAATTVQNSGKGKSSGTPPSPMTHGPHDWPAL